jgi:hypothetical protein
MCIRDSNKELIPKITLSYDRIAFYAKDNPDLRVTFDFNITSRRDHISLGRLEQDQKIIDDEWYIMEIKTPYAMPLWLTQTLTKYRLFNHSFSKYGSEYFTHLMTERKDDSPCLNPYLPSPVQP